MLRLQWFFLQVLDHLHRRVLRIDGDGGRNEMAERGSSEWFARLVRLPGSG